jgi:hypothetical protein
VNVRVLVNVPEIPEKQGELEDLYSALARTYAAARRMTSNVPRCPAEDVLTIKTRSVTAPTSLPYDQG